MTDSANTPAVDALRRAAIAQADSAERLFNRADEESRMYFAPIDEPGKITPAIPAVTICEMIELANRTLSESRAALAQIQGAELAGTPKIGFQPAIEITPEIQRSHDVAFESSHVMARKIKFFDEITSGLKGSTEEKFEQARRAVEFHILGEELQANLDKHPPNAEDLRAERFATSWGRATMRRNAAHVAEKHGENESGGGNACTFHPDGSRTYFYACPECHERKVDQAGIDACLMGHFKQSATDPREAKAEATAKDLFAVIRGLVGNMRVTGERLFNGPRFWTVEMTGEKLPVAFAALVELVRRMDASPPGSPVLWARVHDDQLADDGRPLSIYGLYFSKTEAENYKSEDGMVSGFRVIPFRKQGGASK